MKRKYSILALATLALLGVLLPGCGGKSNDDVPPVAKDGATKNREGGDPGTPGTATPGAAVGTGASAPTGTAANPQPAEGK